MGDLAWPKAPPANDAPMVAPKPVAPTPLTSVRRVMLRLSLPSGFLVMVVSSSSSSDPALFARLMHADDCAYAQETPRSLAHRRRPSLYVERKRVTVLVGDLPTVGKQVARAGRAWSGCRPLPTTGSLIFYA